MLYQYSGTQTIIMGGGATMIIAINLFILAGLAEIGGGYLIWLWLRESKPLWYGIVGSLILVAYGIIPTLQRFPTFGRVYAAYGGVVVILAVLGDGSSIKKHPICMIG
jgi:small multidrug resistance family-3 protein